MNQKDKAQTKTKACIFQLPLLKLLKAHSQVRDNY